MRVTTKGKYGLMMMIEIAVNSGERAIALKTVAKNLKISEKYLEQIIIPVMRAGYVRSVRGAQGGYVLAVDPAALTASMIIEALEGEQSLRACKGEVGECDRIDYCVAIEVWQEVNLATTKILDSITLQCLCDRQRGKLAKLHDGQMSEVLTMKPACADS